MKDTPRTSPAPSTPTLSGGAAAVAAPDAEAPVLLLGNPNVGKSVLFGLLTRRYVTVSNYPGTTVTLSHGKTDLDGESVEVIDTPGINSLTPMSEDEEVTRNLLLERPPRAIVQVADAKNLRRALILSSQLAEMGLPFALDLNMTDEAGALGVEVDDRRLQEILGVPVVRTVAVRRQGLDRLRRALSAQQPAHLEVTYPEAVEHAIAQLEPLLPAGPIRARSLAVMLLHGDESLREWLRTRLDPEQLAAVDRIVTAAQAASDEPLASVIMRARFARIDAILQEVEKRPERRRGTLTDRLGSWSMHPVWGVPVLLFVLWAMYQFVGVFGAGTLVDLLETRLFGEHLSPWAIQGVDAILRFPHTHALDGAVLLPEYTHPALGTGQEVARFFHDFLVGPYGQVTMAVSYAIAIILPIVATFFLAFGMLEDSGYLPRLAVMVNRVFKSIGLNGKAVLPMVLGLGCDTMATLTTRILETRKERILVTLLLALGVPCSAQLGVILGMIRSLSWMATLVWSGTILLTLFVVGWAAARLVPGQGSDFVLELPPIRRPRLANLGVKTLARIEWYLREAAPLFLLGTAILFVLDRVQALRWIERAASPVVEGVLGLPAAASQAFLVGFLRRDYGAAGLYEMSRHGQLDPVQLVVSMVTITLFVPCIANFLIMIKERGLKTAVWMVAFIVPFALVVGGALNTILRALGVTFS